MPDEVDNVILQASVVDDFSDTLDELQQQLLSVSAQEEEVDPVDIDANVSSAIAQIGALNSAIESIDDDVDVDVDVDRERMPLDRIGGNRLYSPELDAMRQGMFDIEMGDDGHVDLAGLPNMNNGQDMFGDDFPIDGSGLDIPLLGGGGWMDDDDGGRGVFSRGAGLTSSIGDSLTELGQSRVTMSQLMGVLAALVPLLVVFVGALPAAISGLVAIAGAALAAAAGLGAIAGLGMFGMMIEGGEFDATQLRQELRETLDAFLQSFGPLAESLAPLMADAFDTMRRILRDVGARARELLSLTSGARGVLDGMEATIGPFVTDLIRFAEAGLPVLNLLVGGLADIDFFNIFADMVRDTLPMLVVFTDAVLGLLGPLYNLSLGFFAVATAITTLVGGFLQLITVHPAVAQGIGVLISAFLALLTVSTLVWLSQTQLAGIMSTLSAAVIPSAVTAVYTYIASLIQAAIVHVAEYIPAVIAANAATLASAAAFIITAGAAATLVGVLTFGLAPALSSIAGGFFGIGNGVRDATSAMSEFRRQQNQLGAGSSEFAMRPAGSGAGSAGYSQPQNSANIMAPDDETGTQVVHTMNFTSGEKQTSNSDYENRIHGE